MNKSNNDLKQIYKRVQETLQSELSNSIWVDVKGRVELMFSIEKGEYRVEATISVEKLDSDK